MSAPLISGWTSPGWSPSDSSVDDALGFLEASMHAALRYPDSLGIAIISGRYDLTSINQDFSTEPSGFWAELQKELGMAVSGKLARLPSTSYADPHGTYAASIERGMQFLFAVVVASADGYETDLAGGPGIVGTFWCKEDLLSDWDELQTALRWKAEREAQKRTKIEPKRGLNDR